VHRLGHAVALAFEESDECPAHLGVVLDDQDGGRWRLGYHLPALSAHLADSSRTGFPSASRFSNVPCGPRAANLVASGAGQHPSRGHGIGKIPFPSIDEKRYEYK